MSTLPAAHVAPRRVAAQRRAAALHRAGGSRATLFATIALVAVIAILAIGIELSQQQSRSHLLSTFALRGTSSATFVSTFLNQQADREMDTASRFLAAQHVSAERFALVVDAFGSSAAVLLDSSGRVLDVVPADRSLMGERIASSYAHLAAAEAGHAAVSNVVASAVKRAPVAAVAVSFGTPEGRRVFSVAYAVSGSTLGAFVDHTISYAEHQVFLIDSSGNLVAASPRTRARSLGEVDPALRRSIEHSSLGSIQGAAVPSTFTVAQVPGTSWRLVIAVPNSRLFASIEGWTKLIPWLVLALVSVLGVALVALFARVSSLSQAMSESARTDSLTGLFNRRAVGEQMARAAAHARRRGEPMAVLMIDLDRFKLTNDSFGHAAGDRVLCALADCMREVVRAEDLPGRWGGDEFIILMPCADEHDASKVAERLQAAARRADLSDVGLPEGVGMSVGVACAIDTSAEEIVHAADLALYQAKAERADERDRHEESLAAPSTNA
jgi:diguanylate cyclase (GGDEF)-like protein